MNNKFLKGWKKSPFNFHFLMVTWFWTGLTPKAPGTFGSIAALPFAWMMLEYSEKIGFDGRITLGIATIIITYIGLYSTKIYLKETGKTDPGEVVIDEVAGQWLVCMAMTTHHDGGQFLLALLAFRMFDIMKPWPISVVDRRHDAYGVMFDDIVAGVMGAAVLIGVNHYLFS